MKHVMALVAVLSAMVLTGCTTISGVPYDRSASSKVKVIGLVTPYFPTRARIATASNLGQSAGILGVFVESTFQANRELNLASKLASQNFDARAIFITSLKQSLQKDGYTIIDVPLERTKPELLMRYPRKTTPPLDAYLDIVVSAYGYVAAGIGDNTPYRPFVLTNARLTKQGGSTVLMRDHVEYNPITKNPQNVTIPVDVKYVFVDNNALQADPANAAAGIRQSLDTTAQTIGRLLK